MSAPKQHNYIKIVLYLKKRKDITDEKFHEHWRNHHANTAKGIPGFMNRVKRYSQFHVSLEQKAAASELGAPVLDFDGGAEVWLESIEDWKAICEDPQFIEEIFPDEKVFIEAPIHIMIGSENLVIGEPLEFNEKHHLKK